MMEVHDHESRRLTGRVKDFHIYGIPTTLKNKLVKIVKPDEMNKDFFIIRSYTSARHYLVPKSMLK